MITKESHEREVNKFTSNSANLNDGLGLGLDYYFCLFTSEMKYRYLNYIPILTLLCCPIRGCTQLGSIFTFKYYTWVEVTNNGKLFSLL